LARRSLAFSLAWRVQISLPVYAVIGKRAVAAA